MCLLPGSFFRSISTFLSSLLSNPTIVIETLAPYFFPLGSFALFLVWNGGTIVLGDKSNHVAALHFPQLFYFVGFAIAFLLPILPIAELVSRLAKDLTMRNLHAASVVMAGEALLVNSYTWVWLILPRQRFVG